MSAAEIDFDEKTAEIDFDEKTAEIDFDEKTAEGFPIWRCWGTKNEWYYCKTVLDFSCPKLEGVENWANLDREEKKVYIRRFRRTERTIRLWKVRHCLHRPEIYGLKPYGPGSKADPEKWKVFYEMLWRPIWPTRINRYIQCDCGRPVCKETLDKMDDIWEPSVFLMKLWKWEAEHDRFHNMDDGSEEENDRRNHGEFRSTAAE